MVQILTRRLVATTVTTLSLAAGVPALAGTLQITVTNPAMPGGVTITPVLGAFHDGSFDPFDAGSAASTAIETIAEEGNPAPLAGSLGASGVSGVAVADANGIPPIEPGESAQFTLSVDPAFRYFSYFSMVLPSNDTFIGNDDPFAYEIYDAGGAFLGPQVITVTGLDAWDAGTEENLGAGSPFVPAFAGTTGTDEAGLIASSTGIDNFAGLMVANGQVIDAGAIGFAGNGGFALAEIRIEEVPVPGALAMMLSGLAFLGLGRRRAA